MLSFDAGTSSPTNSLPCLSLVNPQSRLWAQIPNHSRSEQEPYHSLGWSTMPTGRRPAEKWPVNQKLHIAFGVVRYCHPASGELKYST
ncbi:MAG: hypothetical protein KatS3mg110_1576 [Pirellulaceae bacterium]|nr:MAG: hypothetical protein KatS3mg110_1576 [Pirellulaceae bacterium]